MRVRNRFIYFAVRARTEICLVLEIWRSCTITSFADEATKPVTITATSSVEIGDSGSVPATADSAKYRVVSCEFIDKKTSWKIGEIPRISIELMAERDYYFGSISSPDAYIWGTEYMPSKKSDVERNLTVTARLEGVKRILDRVKKAYQERMPLGEARWSKVNGASSYEARLFCDENMIYHMSRTNSVSYDFFLYMTEEGDCYFKVRAATKTGSKSNYLKAGGWTKSDDQQITRKDARTVDKRAASQGKGTAGVGVKNGTGSNIRAPGWTQDENG